MSSDLIENTEYARKTNANCPWVQNMDFHIKIPYTDKVPYNGKVFSFAETVQGHCTSVRLTDDGLMYAVDLVMAMTGKNCNDSGQVLRRLSKKKSFVHRRIIYRFGIKTKLINFTDAIELIMILPGNSAKNVRKQFTNVIARYLDGDRSMCSDIEANYTIGKVKSYRNFASEGMKNIDNSNKTDEMPQTCYVYATKSTAFPGLIKIGKTNDVSCRVCGLNTSCAPAPHVIVAVAPTFNKDRDEKTAHSFFSDERREGEFFQLSDAVVVAYFTTHITSQYYIELGQKIADLQGPTKSPWSITVNA